MSAVERIVERILKDPFIVPVMSSHGGATAEGRVKVCESLGVPRSIADVGFYPIYKL